MIIAKVRIEQVRCDFNLFFVYSNFKPAIDNEDGNEVINRLFPYVWFRNEVYDNWYD